MERDPEDLEWGSLAQKLFGSQVGLSLAIAAVPRARDADHPRAHMRLSNQTTFALVGKRFPQA